MDLKLPTRIYRYVVLLKRAGIPVNVEEDGPDRWVMTVDPEYLPEGDALAVVYTRRRNGRIRKDVELVIDGERQDVSDLMTAIARLGQGTATGGSSAVADTAGPARTNSVETRRATVIRV